MRWEMSEALKCKELYEALDKACRSVTELIGFSYGVDGLHMNGDVAPWEDLRYGGRYESWLVEFDEALEVLRKYAEEEGDE